MAKAGFRILRCDLEEGLHGAVIHSPAFAHQFVVLIEDMNGALHVCWFTLNCQPIIMEESRYVKRRLEELDVLIQSAKEVLHLSGNLYGTSHRLRGHHYSAAGRSGNISSKPIGSPLRQPS